LYLIDKKGVEEEVKGADENKWAGGAPFDLAIYEFIPEGYC
jgi:hypothetical protein